MNELLEQYVPPVYRFALSLTGGDRHAAEDLAQETMLRAWRHRRKLRDPATARSWLFRIAANLWRDELRRRAVRHRAAPRLGASVLSTAGAVAPDVQREEAERALQALHELPGRQREVVHLCVCEGLSIGEAARVLGIGSGAVKASLSAGRSRLREILARRSSPRCLSGTNTSL